MATEHESENGGGVGSSVWLECVVCLEHGWLCIRNTHGWLLWSSKASEIDLHRGVVLADITKELEARQAEWQCDHDEMEEAQHSNAELTDAAPPAASDCNKAPTGRRSVQ